MKLDFSRLTQPAAKAANNFQRTAAWLHACGKKHLEPSHLSVQIGCHLEEVAEFLDQIEVSDGVGIDEANLCVATGLLLRVAENLKRKRTYAHIPDDNRERALDALCDMEVTGNGVAYLAGFNKEEADLAVLAANEAKLVDGKPVILEGGKIGKPPGWRAADLSEFV